MTEQRLSGKRIAITGAARGLGRALAIVAADQGANPVLLGRGSGGLEDVAATIRSRTATDPQVVTCDLADTDSINAACGRILSTNETLDVLINNGAPWLEGAFEGLSDDDITSTIAAAVSGTVLITKGLLPGLRQSTAADIITIVSSAGIPGWDVGGGSVPFFAAKHGQSGFNDKLRHELRGTGIRVSAIYPPDFDDADPTDISWQEHADKNLSNRDIVALTMFILSSPRSACFPMVIVDGMS